MFTNGTGDYPDIEAALARLEDEDPPAHVRAQRLAALHVAMAQANHRAVEAMRRVLETLQEHGDPQFAALQKSQDAGSTKVQRSIQDLQRGMEARVVQVEQELMRLRQELPRRQHGGRGHMLSAGLVGALIGILALTALWLALGQTMRVHVLPQPQVHGQQKGT